MVAQSFLAMGITLSISKGIDLLTGEPTVNRIMLIVGSILLMGMLQWVCGYFQKKAGAEKRYRHTAGASEQAVPFDDLQKYRLLFEKFLRYAH